MTEIPIIQKPVHLISIHCKSMNWFLGYKDLRIETVNLSITDSEKKDVYRFSLYICTFFLIPVA